MRRLFTVMWILLLSVMVAPSTRAGQWQPSDTDRLTDTNPAFSVNLTSADGSDENRLCMFPIAPTADGFGNAIIPLTMNRMKLSSISISTGMGANENSEGYTPVNIQLNTGLQTSHFLTPPSIGPAPEAFDSGSEWSATTYILFFGVDLNLGPGFIQTQAFISQPPEDAPVSGASMPNLMDKPGADMSAKGFNAIAGFKLNDRITVKAGCGYIDQNDKKAGTSDEAWAIYAQAILSLAPGVQVIPGIGQIDFDKDKSSNDAQDNFFAGAKWEINF